ncbi:MAG: hypothetical protein ACFB4I_04225 [Cyanophyceae cyanobacterium]
MNSTQAMLYSTQYYFIAGRISHQATDVKAAKLRGKGKRRWRGEGGKGGLEGLFLSPGFFPRCERDSFPFPPSPSRQGQLPRPAGTRRSDF